MKNKRRIRRGFACAMAVAMLAGGTLPASAQTPQEAFTSWLSNLTVTRITPGAPGESPYQIPATLTAEEHKAHTDTMFELVNLEREKARLLPLERDSILDEAAMIRATEIQAVDIA